MKKYGLVITLVVVLGALALYMSFLGDQESDASSETFSDFAIADTSLVETFIISDTENNSITITRKADGKTWMIGDSKYKALPSSVDLITNTFQRIRVKQDVPEKAIKNVLTSLAVRHKNLIKHGSLAVQQTIMPEHICYLKLVTQNLMSLILPINKIW